MDGRALRGLGVGLAIGFALGMLVARFGPPQVIVREIPVGAGSSPPDPATSPSPVPGPAPTPPKPADTSREEPVPVPPPEEKVEPHAKEQAAPAAAPAGEDPYAREKRIRDAVRSEFKVKVVDAETGAPMAGVDWSIFVGTFRTGGSSTWGRTRADGSFGANPKRLLEGLGGGRRDGFDFRTFGTEEDPLRADVRIRVPGYKAFVAPATGASLDVKLERERNPRPFGTLAGRVLAADGTPFVEPFPLSLQDPEVLDSYTTWVLPGPDGRFHQAGLLPGAWGAKVNSGWGPRVAVDIPPGGVAEVEIRAPDDDGPRDGLPGKRRPVVVTLGGRELPFGGAVLLDGEWGAPLRAEVSGGRASFPEVPAGAVRIVLRRPDGMDEVTAAGVPEGEGSLELPFPPAR